MRTSSISFSKRFLSFVLAMLLLVSTMITNYCFIAGAWTQGTYKISDDITGAWDSNATNTMTGSGNDYYFNYYLKKSDAKVYFRFYGPDSKNIGADAGDNTAIDTSQKKTNDNGNNFYFDPNWLSDSTKFYTVRIHLDLSSWAGSGGAEYSMTAKDNMTATVSSNKNAVTLGNSVTLTGGTSNLFGVDCKYKYEYSKDNGDWTEIGTNTATSTTDTKSWIPSATGTYRVRVTVTDTTVKKGTNARSDRTATTDSSGYATITVNPAETTYTVTKQYQVNGGTVTSDGTQEGVGSQTATTMNFTPYRTSGNKRYKLTGFDTSNVTVVTHNLTTGVITATASSNTNYITALYATEADYRKFYFKQPSGWSSSYAYLWVSSSNSENHEYTGIQLQSGNLQAASGAGDDDYGVCDYVGSESIQNGSNTDTYYYYKTYRTAFDRLIFNDNSNSTKTRDINLGNIQSETAQGETYELNQMYYVPNGTGSEDTGKWYHLPAALYDVSISATDSSVSRVNTTGATSATGTVSASSAAVNATTTVDVTLTAPDGYTIASTPWDITGNVTATLKTNTSDSEKVYTISATGDGSISPNFVETPHTITVYRRLFNTAGEQQGSNTQLTTYTAGISSCATITQPDAVSGDYSWNTYTLGGGITNKNNSTLTQRATLAVQAKKSGTYEVYEDYKETLNTITFKNDGHGSVKRGTETIVDAGVSNSGTTGIGNITGITIVAQASLGYEFDSWEVTSGSGNVTIGNTSSASTTFRATGDATVKAKFRPVQYSISASFVSGNEYNSSNVVNTYASDGTTIKTGGEIGNIFQIRITLASGYDLDNITFTSGSGYVEPTLTDTTTSGSTIIKTYTLGAGDAVATVSLKAKDVSVSDVQIEKETADNTFSYQMMSDSGDNNTVNVFYKQPIKVKASIDNYTTETASISIGNASQTGKNYSDLSPDPVTLEPTNLVGSDVPSGSVSYTLTLTVTNAPDGVQSKTVTKTYTVKVFYNTAQQAYLKIKTLYENSVEDNASTAALYYSDFGEYLTAFNTARTQAANDYRGTNWNQWPDYNSEAAQGTDLNTYYNNFKTKFDDLQRKAKTTTVYVLSKYNSSFMSIDGAAVVGGDDTADFKHFKQYHLYLNSSTYHKAENNYTGHIMRKEGTVVKNSTTYYLYSFTYAGHAKVRVYAAESKAESWSEATSLTGNSNTAYVTGLTDFKNYYINVYNTNNNSSAVPTKTDFDDLQTYRTDIGKVYVESGVDYNASQIRSKLGLAYKGSLNSDNPNADISEVKFEVQTTKGGEDYTNMLAPGATWRPSSHGRYKVKYQVKYTDGTDSVPGGGATFITEEDEYFVYVAWDEISVYVDMNGNVGTPTINFTYDTNKNLPFDLNLVSGSESIYEYTLDLKKLKSDYNISYMNSNQQYQPITINKITVDGTQIGAEYTIQTDAYASGSVWFKANSTSLTTFQNISSASSRTTFRAVVDSSGAYIEDGIKTVSGTGIITENDGTREIDGIHHVVYAAKDDLEFDFNYNVRATVNKEVTLNGNVYYFDRWMKMPSPDEVAMTSGDNPVPSNLSISSLIETGVEKADYNINRCPVYDNGDFTYVAVYKPAATTSVVRVEVNYSFKDYNTSDGNYIYDEHKDLVDANYTKTVKIPLNQQVNIGGTEKTYTSYAQVQEDIEDIADAKMPVIKSNYFDYSYEEGSAREVTTGTNASDSTNKKIIVNAKLTHSAHKYKMYVVKDSTQTLVSGDHYYQQTVDLDASTYGIASGKVYWYIKDAEDNEVVLSNERTYTARFVQSTADLETDSIKIYLGSGEKDVDKSSTIINAYSETYKDGDTDKVRHNFYIVDYFDESVEANGDFIGAGVLYATTDLEGNYRQSIAGSTLDNAASMKDYIANALGVTYDSSTDVASSSDTKYDVEFEPQTINNVGFRYLPASGKEGKDKLRYSEMLKAYQYIFGAQMNNSSSYSNQKLRVFSYFIYKSSNQYKIVVSGSYAEVQRYYPQTEQS